MKKNRCLWVSGMIGLGLVFLFTLRQIFLILDGIIFLLPIVSAICNRQISKKIQVHISQEQVIIKNDSRIGIPKMTIKIVLNNLLTMEADENLYICSIEGKKKAILNFKIPKNHCGCIRVNVSEIYLFDIWKIFSYQVICKERMEAKIWPIPFEQEIIVKEGSLNDLDSMEYSTQKPGNDPGEMFDIKDYIPGDRLSNIHWKLSGKYDKLMVIRPGLPLDNSILLLFETISINEKMPTPNQIHTAATIFFSLSKNLLSIGRNHRVGWVNGYTGKFIIFDIASEDEFIGAMSKMLLSGYHKGKENVWMQYRQIYELEQNTHIIYVGYERPEDMEYEKRITVLLSDYSQEELYYLEI